LSLVYLQKLPVSELKIDRSFIDGTNDQPGTQRCRRKISTANLPERLTRRKCRKNFSEIMRAYRAKTVLNAIQVFLCNLFAAGTGRKSMRFYLFERRIEAHIRKSREYLEEAHVRRVEHQAAAEHHSALTQMYAERIARIEAEMGETFQHRADKMPLVEDAGNENVRLKSDSVLIYPSRASHA